MLNDVGLLMLSYVPLLPQHVSVFSNLKRHRQMYDDVASFTEPQFNKDQPVFTHINSSHARLNLQGWASGGCPISAVTLEFRPKGESLLFPFAIVGNILGYHATNQQENADP